MHPCSVKVCLRMAPGGSGDGDDRRSSSSNKYKCNDKFVDSVLFSDSGHWVVEARVCNPPRLYAEEIAQITGDNIH